MVIQLPDEGQYGLDIYARDPDFQSEKRTMSHCCKYLLNYKKLTAPVAPPPPPPQQAPLIPPPSSNSSLGLPPPPPSSANHQQQQHHSSSHPHHNHHHYHHNHNNSIDLPANVKIGPNADLLTALGMQPLSHPDPIIRLLSTVEDTHPPDIIDIQFKMSKAVDFSFDLKHAPSGSSSSSFLPLKSTDLVKVSSFFSSLSLIPKSKYT